VLSDRARAVLPTRQKVLADREVEADPADDRRFGEQCE
jgi:hypothetical protein